MTRPIDEARLLARDEIVPGPTHRACQDHGFELPPGVYRVMAALFFGFLRF